MSYCKLRRNNASSGGCAPDRPSNPGLASENNKKLENMLAERAKQDAMLFGAPVQQQQPPQPQPSTK